MITLGRTPPPLHRCIIYGWPLWQTVNIAFLAENSVAIILTLYSMDMSSSFCYELKMLHLTRSMTRQVQFLPMIGTAI